MTINYHLSLCTVQRVVRSIEYCKSKMDGPWGWKWTFLDKSGQLFRIHLKSPRFIKSIRPPTLMQRSVWFKFLTVNFRWLHGQGFWPFAFINYRPLHTLPRIVNSSLEFTKCEGFLILITILSTKVGRAFPMVFVRIPHKAVNRRRPSGRRIPL